MCNEEEDPKSPINWWLKAYNLAIDFGELIHQNQGPKTRNRELYLTGDRRDSTRPEAPHAALEKPRKRGFYRI